MPREKTGDGFDYRTYIKEYIKEKIVYRKLNFSRANEEDMEMLAWIDSQPEGKTRYIKRLIRADMEARKQPE